MLEHDPNASRRKRQKIDKSNDTDHSDGSIVNYITAKGPPSASNGESSSVDYIPTSTGNEDHGVVEVGDSTLPSTPSPELPHSSTATSDSTVNKETPRRSPRQKTIKLNANGKLLSSPVAKSDDKSKKKDKRRGKSGVQIDGKVVAIKYANRGEAGASLGKLIDDIINGRQRHNPPPIRQQPIRPAPKKDEPVKATHPFFLKKSSRKTDVLQPQIGNQDSTIVNPEQEGDTKAPRPSNKPSIAKLGTTAASSFTPTRLRSSKFPEATHAVWPPRGFTHVRGLHAESQNDFQPSLNADRKKAKMAAIRIQDKESVLSPELQGLCEEPQKVLRIPERHVASGHILQRAIAEQLSQYTLFNPDRFTLNDMCHPAIAKLYNSIPNSMTAFDRGEYEHSLWSQKYAPNSAGQVLQTTKEASMLRDWLRFLMVSAVDTGKASKDCSTKRSPDKKKRNKRRKTENLDGFIVSSADEASELGELEESEEDELAGGVTVSSKRTVIRSGDLSLEKGRVSNVILLSGPSGCGKTASVYAAAKELDFEVFEINAGNRRSARDIVERVGDMTRNHLVHNVGGSEEKSSRQSYDTDSENSKSQDSKQNKLKGFFKSTSANSNKDNKDQRDDTEKQTGQKRSRGQKQSFILLEEADLIFEEDKQFWSGVLTLINQSKRPIIITCNDESLIPLEDLSFHAILRYRPPPPHLVIDYLLLLAANEGHMLKREAISDLYTSTDKDLRRTITELNFWCQMAIGSEKSGLDWMIDRWPRGSDVDEEGHPLRVISVNSYEPFMGWFSRDMFLSNSLNSVVESQREAFSWWDVSPQDAEIIMDLDGVTQCSPATSRLERLDILKHQSDLMDMRSALDVLSSDCSLDFKLDSMDTSIPPIPEKQRANYVEGYSILNADVMPSHSSLSLDIASTFEVLISRAFRPCPEGNVESSQAEKVLVNITKLKSADIPRVEFAQAFEPIMRANYVFPLPTGRLSPSFENGLGPITEDLGPYVRAIMAFDLRLEQYRLQLSGLLSENAQGPKKVRKTRASRAALEGGSKAETRKERWLPADANPFLILATGKKEWQDLLVQSGYFTVASSAEEPGQECSDQPVESSSEGGI
ncbi:hypothetical protein BBP40_000204 [Aspergillus hancockii]|nr:hypothetical protein BBP40_000204 [Aspergillus hancockii]